MWSSSEYSLYCYESAGDKIVDKYYYVCDDRINDFVVAPVVNSSASNAVLAC